MAVIADGEVSSPVTGDGVGGRNLAFVLDSVKKIAGGKIAVLSAGTDGVDGSSPAAGAVADGETLARAQSLGIDRPNISDAAIPIPSSARLATPSKPAPRETICATCESF